MTQTSHNTRRALFPGSFNPFTRGHQSLVDRALDLFDEIVIAVGISLDKHNSDDIESRMTPVKQLYKNNPHVSVIYYTGLTVDAAREHDCQYILRGIRNTVDMEYERSMADINRRLTGIETILLFTLPQDSMLSSSIVRELKHYGHDVSDMLPTGDK